MFVWLTTISVPATNKLLDGRKKTAPIPISLMFENNWLIVPGLLLVASFLCLLVQRKWMAYACFLVFPVLASTIVIIALLFAIQGLNRTIWHVLRGES